MNSTVEDIIKDGIQMSNTSNVKSFVKRLEALPYEERTDVLKSIFRHHYEKGNYDVFDTIRNELRILDGVTAPPNMPAAPRGAWYNTVRRPNGNSSILIGNSIYTQKKGKANWTVKGGKKNRKAKRKTRRTRTRSHR